MEKSFTEYKQEMDRGWEPDLQLATKKYYILEKNGYSFKFLVRHTRVTSAGNDKDTISEVFYDLRNKEYYLKRNGKEVMFNQNNLNEIFPYAEPTWAGNDFDNEINAKKLLNLLCVKENKGMYVEMIDLLSRQNYEYTKMTSRVLIRLITKYNKLELMFKAGVPLKIFSSARLLNSVLKRADEGATKIHELFGLTKAQFKFFKKFHLEPGLYDDLERHYMTPEEVVQRRLDVRYEDAPKFSYLSQKDMDFYPIILQRLDELVEKYDDPTRKSAFEDYHCAKTYAVSKGRREYNFSYNVYDMAEELNHPNILRLIEYIAFECYHSQGLRIRDAVQTYTDYYRMSVAVGRENFEKYPKYLKTYHDIVARNYKLIEDEERSKLFASAVSQYEEFEGSLRGEGKGYAIVVPKSTNDLVTEGNELRHCVASYVDKVVEKRSVIMFLRETKDVESPLVTVEVKGDVIVQARGASNRRMTKEESKALKYFALKNNLEVKI